jgi:hypothetical protein
MIYVFWGVWALDVTFVQPDNATIYASDFFSRKWCEFAQGSGLVPWECLKLLGGPYVWQELQYALAMYLAMLGVAYYLRGRGLSFPVCYGAGAAYGLMGYNFTLFSAGHLGWFELLTSAPFCFGLVDRCVRKGKLANWILLGGLLAWGGVHQPDIWLMFTIFTFVYGLYRFAYALISQKDAARRMKLVARIFAGAAVVALVMFVTGLPQLHNALFVHTANRDKQIAQSTETSSRGGESKDAMALAAEREKRYVFCTNWSLPPDEIVEFVIPGLKGYSSDPRVSPRDRYTGRIGMQIAPGRWAPYRQHSLYMGFLTVVFALLGMIGAICRKRNERDVLQEGAQNRGEIVFWSISAAVLLLIAFGGFTPFYRLIFALPMGDYIRCPVKYVHLVEWCIAVLAGFGAAFVLSSAPARKAPRIVAAAVFALFAVNMISLTIEDAKFKAVDPADTMRIAVSRDVGSASIGLVMDAAAQLGKEEYFVASGIAFRDNAKLKEALSKGELTPVSYWNFRNGRFMKTSREQAGFALLKPARNPTQSPTKMKPGLFAILSMLGSFVVCATGILKICRIHK